MDTKAIKKSTIVAVSVIALLVAALCATLAILHSESNTVTNNMTAGTLTATMDEAVVDQYGEKQGEQRTTKGTTTVIQSYTLVPGHKYTLDPVAYVGANNQPCYLYALVKNTLSADNEADYETYGKIAQQLTDNGWEAVSESPYVPTGYTLYVHKTGSGYSVPTSSTEQSFQIIKGFKISDSATLTASEISVKVEAIQSDGYLTPKAAWDAVHPNPGP